MSNSKPSDRRHFESTNLRIFFRETELVYANVSNNIQFRGKNRRFLVSKFMTLCDELVISLESIS